MTDVKKFVKLALENKISFQQLFNEIENIDVIDAHYNIQKLILKPESFLIDNPPSFYQFICLLTYKPELIDCKQLVHFFSDDEKILIYFWQSQIKNMDTPPKYLDNTNPSVFKKYIKNFPPTIFQYLSKIYNVKDLSSIIDECNDEVFVWLYNNLDSFLFFQIVGNLQQNKWIKTILNCEYPSNLSTDLKKHFRTATQYNPLFVLFASKLLENDGDFFIEVYLQQHNHTKQQVCPFLSFNIINSLIQHFLFINLQNYDFSWLDFSQSQANILDAYLKEKSKKLNNILTNYSIKTISEKYDKIKKMIIVSTAFSNAIGKNSFKLSETAISNLYKSGAILFAAKTPKT